VSEDDRQVIVHMVGNAHIDPIWLWTVEEGREEVLASYRTAVSLLREFDGYVFTSGATVTYRWVAEDDPALFEEIRAAVAAGRWNLVTGWWVQPDCNLPSGESFARHALYGQRYLEAVFGRRARVGYAVDSFGHAGTLPQLLALGGLDSYVFFRPGPKEKDLPVGPFWWEGPDGSRVLACRPPLHYGTPGDVDIAARIEAAAVEGATDRLPLTMCFYGVGNHGGGPTRENIESIRRLNDDPDFPRLVFSDPDTFFEAIEARDLPIPVVHDELQHHASGCYAAHSGIKRWNRQAENRLISAEKFAAIAYRLTGMPYPREEFARAWKQVLFNQFHDTLAGTSLEAAYDDARDQYGEALAIADRTQNDAVQSIAWAINIPLQEGVKPLTVFNPHAWRSRANVAFQVRGLPTAFALRDDEDRAVAVQDVQSWATSGGQRRLTFTADLPPLGYRTYRIVPVEEAPAFETSLSATDHTVENRFFRLAFDAETGEIASLFDKRHGVEVFAGPAARAVVIDDPSDTWSHDVFRFQNEIGGFTATSVRLVESGPVLAIVRVTSAFGDSTLVQDFTLYDGLPQIDVQVTVDWREQHKLLKLRFPVNQIFIRAVYEIPYGHIERETTGDEEPGQSWLDLSGTVRETGEKYGLSLLNDGKYSFDVNVRDIGLTALRSPIYAHHIPAQPQPDRDYRYIDQGMQTFTYSLLPHAGSWETAGTVRRAAELNQRPIALLGTYHDGPLPQSRATVEVTPENIVVGAVKLAEDNDDLIVRCYESTRVATDAELRVGERVIPLRFGVSEIKTLRVPRDDSQPVMETNLLELEDEPLP